MITQEFSQVLEIPILTKNGAVQVWRYLQESDLFMGYRTERSIIGFIVGLLGRGGGSFVVPTLLFLGFSPKRTAATSAFVCTFSALSGFIAHAQYGSIDWTLALTGSIAAIIGSQLGSRFMVKKVKSETLKIIFSIVLILIGIELIFKEIF